MVIPRVRDDCDSSPGKEYVSDVPFLSPCPCVLTIVGEAGVERVPLPEVLVQELSEPADNSE